MPTAYNGRSLPLAANSSGHPTWVANLALAYDFTGFDTSSTDGSPWIYTGGTKPTLAKTAPVTYPTYAGEPGSQMGAGGVYAYTSATDYGLQVGTGDFTLGVRFSTAGTLAGSAKNTTVKVGVAGTDQLQIVLQEDTSGWYLTVIGGANITLGTAQSATIYGTNKNIVAWVRRVGGVTSVYTQDATVGGALVLRYAAGATNAGALNSSNSTRLQIASIGGVAGVNIQGVYWWREGLDNTTMQAAGQDWYAINTNGVAASTIAITSPTAGSSIPATVTISGTYTSTAPTSVQVQHGAGSWVTGTGLSASGGTWSASFVLSVASAAALRARYGNDTTVVSSDVANITVIAKSIGFTYPAAGSPTPTDVCPYRIFQRKFDGSGVSVQVSGTYAGGTPAAIQWRWNGGSWATLVSGPSGGTFSAAVTLSGTGQGDLEVRWSDDTTVSAACSSVGVGDVYFLGGQSNNVGGANAAYVAPVAPAGHPTWKHTELDKSGVWRENVETSATPMSSIAGAQYTPWQTGSAYGSYAGRLATTLMATHDVPVAVIPCAVGSTSLAGWAVPTPYNNTAQLYGCMATRANQVGDHRGVIWWQGEFETGTSQTQAAHESGLNALINDWYTRFGKKWFLVNLCSTGNGSNLATIRAAIANVAATNANVYGLADMDVPTPAFTTTIHYGATTTEIDNVAARMYSGMLSAGLYSVPATISGAGGIASSAAVGAPTVTGIVGADISGAGGIASSASVGVPTVGGVWSISSAGGIVSASAVGTPTVTGSTGGGTAEISGAGGIASAASVGTPRVTVPGATGDEPVTVAEAKLAARLEAEDTELDLYIEGVITAAREQAEQITGRVYKLRTFTVKLKDWPASGQILPVHEPSACEISYWDAAGAWHTMDSSAFEFAAVGAGVEVAPDLDTSWPVLGRKAVGERVRITFTAGPASAGEVSEAVKLYIKAQVTGWARNPSSVAAKDFKASPLLDHLLDSEIVY